MSKHMQRLWIGVGSVAMGLGVLLFASPVRPESPDDDAEEGETADTFLIDDFSNRAGLSAVGTRWRRFTDQVMGGVSTANHRILEEDGRRYIHLTGDVSLENNGGFVQVALDLERGGGTVDFSDYKGVRLCVRATGDAYELHLRNRRTWLPWHYFYHPIKTTDTWTTVSLPFEGFKPEFFEAKLDTRTLKRVAIVAIKKEMQADIAVSRIEFYK